MATGLAERVQRQEERQKQALYYLNAARRVSRSYESGNTLGEAFEAERANLEAHKQARVKRLAVARVVDAQADRYGPVLGWHARLDSRTTPDCRAAHGHNFRATTRPVLGYPGAVHPNCRCVASAPFPEGNLLK